MNDCSRIMSCRCSQRLTLAPAASPGLDMDINLQKALVSVLSKLSVPVFLAGYEEKQSSLTLHVRAGLATDALKLEAERAVTLAGYLLRVRVRGHRLGKLTHPRSLEHWLKRFGTDQIMYDPTHIVSRARGLLWVATSCRSSLGQLVAGSFFDPARRSFVVCARMTKDAAETLALRLRIAGVAQEAWRQAVAGLGGALTAASQFTVRVISDAPSVNLVPVDSRSVSLVARTGQRFRRWVAAAAMAVAMVAAGAPAQAKLPPNAATPLASTSGSDWGVLPGLSVFAEGSALSETNAFALNGLRLYFAEVRYDCRDSRGRKLAPCPPIYLGS